MANLRKRLKKVYGVGINDADYPVHEFEYETDEKGNLKISKRIWTCPFYEIWRDMIKRCYSEKDHLRNPAYVGTTVCEEWLTFSNFKSWMEKQNWEGKQLDKDLLIRGNRVYSPENCIFIPNELNQFFKERSNDRGPYPIGVTYHAKTGKYASRCSDPFLNKRINLGLYSTTESAFEAWRKYKHFLALKYADILEKDGYPEKVLTALRNRYKISENIT
jgi:hypothetical protein